MTTNQISRLIFHTIYFVTIILTCGYSTNQTYEIISLWNIREHNTEIGTFYRCDNCHMQSLNCCIYNYKDKLYDRGESYILDNGKIDSIYSYQVPLGVNVISVEDQIKLSTLDSVYKKQLKNRKIFWNDKLKVIVDGDSIYKTFTIDTNKKYLIIKNNSELKVYKYK